MRIGGLLAIAGATALLSGCATPVPFAGTPLLTSEVPPDSTPAFVSDPVDPGHRLPDETAATLRLDAETAATVRYQGEWLDQQVFLYSGHGTVHLLVVPTDDPTMWGAGSSLGNVPFASCSGDTTDEQWTLQYLPQGTAELPAEWTAFSPHIAARDDVSC